MVNLLSLMKLSPEISIFPYFPACVLRVSGPDSRTFLQSQFTNDLTPLTPENPIYGLWLDRKGRVLADSTVMQGPGDPAEFWLASITSPALLIERHLGSHIIADDVVVTDETAGWRGILVLGAGAAAWLASEPRAGLVFAGRRASVESREWIFPDSESSPANSSVAGARVLSPHEVERMRIESAIASVPADIGPSDLPNEGGLDKEAISYSKGCYTGQEVMARIKSLGRVRRKLVRVQGSGPMPPLPAGLWRGDRREGELRSGVQDAGGFAGLALLSVAAATGGVALSLAPGAAPCVDVAPAA